MTLVEYADLPAMVVASSWACVSASPAGVVRSARPISTASCASTQRAVSNNSAARCQPIRSAKRTLLAASGGTPSSLNGTRMRAVSSIKTRSQKGSKVMPMPTATPLTAAISGLEKTSNASSKTVKPPAFDVVGDPLATPEASSIISLRSWPELKAAPAPVSTTTRTSSFVSAFSSALARSSYCSRVKAFLRSGRFIVMTATPSLISISMLMRVGYSPKELHQSYNSSNHWLK